MESPQKHPEIKEILKMCMDAPGYCLFVGIMTPKKDKSNNNTLEFHYRRYNLSYEDTKISMGAFQQFLQNDITNIPKNEKTIPS